MVQNEGKLLAQKQQYMELRLLTQRLKMDGLMVDWLKTVWGRRARAYQETFFVSTEHVLMSLNACGDEGFRKEQMDLAFIPG